METRKCFRPMKWFELWKCQWRALHVIFWACLFRHQCAHAEWIAHVNSILIASALHKMVVEFIQSCRQRMRNARNSLYSDLFLVIRQIHEICGRVHRYRTTIVAFAWIVWGHVIRNLIKMPLLPLIEIEIDTERRPKMFHFQSRQAIDIILLLYNGRKRRIFSPAQWTN